jgi:proton-coupled amino acid transporter
MVVPNVESLVSLAGAVAGSSTALLIPPILELAWIRHLEKDGIGLGDWEGGPSAASKTTLVQQQHSSSDNGITTGPALPSKRNHHRTRKRKSFWKEKAVSWFLLGMGIIFAAFGSYFSVQDIVQTYLSPSPT